MTKKAESNELGAFREFCSIDPKLHLDSFAVAKLHQKSYFLFYNLPLNDFFKMNCDLLSALKRAENNRCFQEIEVRGGPPFDSRDNSLDINHFFHKKHFETIVICSKGP